ncbi:MAG TPA: hypothetical protein VMF32_08805, partial [Xanthobacteraceae bacterium]|nr:hypothetical protein [Xanthobacteraceae bacterium]
FVKNRQKGTNRSNSWSTNDGRSWGTSESWSESKSFSNTDGWSENIHKRFLLNPDEIGRFLSRTDDRQHPAYPGLLLALIPGYQPLIARRTNYYESEWFEGLYDKHPDYASPKTLAELARIRAERAAARALTSTDTDKGKNLQYCAWGAAAAIAIITVSGFLAHERESRSQSHPGTAAFALRNRGYASRAGEQPAITGDLSGFNADGWPIIAGQAVHLYGVSGILDAASQNALATHWAAVFGPRLYCYTVVANQYRCLSRPFSQAGGEDLAADALNNGFTGLTPDFTAHTYQNFSLDAAADYKAAQSHAKWAGRGIWASTSGQP